MQTVNKTNSFVKITQALFYLNAVIWLVFGIASAVHGVVALIIAVLMLGNAVAMLISGLGLGKRNKWLYCFAVMVIVVNIILTFPDQFGLADFITLVIDVVILVLLIIIRGRHLHANQ